MNYPFYDFYSPSSCFIELNVLSFYEIASSSSLNNNLLIPPFYSYCSSFLIITFLEKKLFSVLTHITFPFDKTLDFYELLFVLLNGKLVEGFSSNLIFYNGSECFLGLKNAPYFNLNHSTSDSSFSLRIFLIIE